MALSHVLIARVDMWFQELPRQNPLVRCFNGRWGIHPGYRKSSPGGPAWGRVAITALSLETMWNLYRIKLWKSSLKQPLTCQGFWTSQSHSETWSFPYSWNQRACHVALFFSIRRTRQRKFESCSIHSTVRLWYPSGTSTISPQESWWLTG